MKPRVVVLGASGMLGAMVLDVLLTESDAHVVATVRTKSLQPALLAAYPEVDWREIDAEHADMALPGALSDADWVINAIGITKPRVKDDDPAQVETAIRVNALFPHLLGRAGIKTLQIATDCVYSGVKGEYVETDAHDALDVYGKSKSLGEAWFPSLTHLRASIVGPEPSERKFLLEWLLKQPPGAQLSGFTNHDWNGVTTLHFARVAAGAIRRQIASTHLSHLIPADRVTKFELLRLFADAFGRTDLKIAPVVAGSKVDRTLRTLDGERNRQWWRGAGYEQPPSIAQMVSELAQYQPRFWQRTPRVAGK